MPDWFTTPDGRKLAFHQTRGQGLGVVFLGGFRSDMTGTKAAHLQAWAETSGRAFLRFDYSGHGQSSGRFEEGCIGDWFADARAIIEGLTTGPQVLVGSSMGGWISLLVARALPHRVAGLVGIAAAPDFTQDLMWDSYPEAEQQALKAQGWRAEPSAYSEDPYVVTLKLIEDGAQHLVLRKPLALPFPVRLLQGTADVDVPPSVALRLLDHATSPDLQLTLVKGADHRFSTPECLDLMVRAIAEVSDNV
ncbi:alpha/beta fold hydrolase [Tabrizicola oligotrophica]|uniref:Alpha/beta hydrolase n=1 Tax=Tabrizicola oligotrophica TaxID=2710650 RepID=A0A6M0QW43_9RHOB|nr:alpha/beta fold hydrolase [Tabrizicola oligotrophica]NEY91617.1 alpha/beta hydrolase [Tabrizicola oligotrophica]